MNECNLLVDSEKELNNHIMLKLESLDNTTVAHITRFVRYFEFYRDFELLSQSHVISEGVIDVLPYIDPDLSPEAWRYARDFIMYDEPIRLTLKSNYKTKSDDELIMILLSSEFRLIVNSFCKIAINIIIDSLDLPDHEHTFGSFYDCLIDYLAGPYGSSIKQSSIHIDQEVLEWFIESQNEVETVNMRVEYRSA